MMNDERLETHIPYLGDNRVPYHCFGKFKQDSCRRYRCLLHIQEACRDSRFDLVEWSPIIMRVEKSLDE